MPPSAAGLIENGVRPCASRYAALRSFLAASAAASAGWVAPFTVPGGNPVIAGVGEVPRSPFTTVWVPAAWVLVTPAAARTAKLVAVPSATVGVAAFAGAPATAPIARMSALVAIPATAFRLITCSPLSFVRHTRTNTRLIRATAEQTACQAPNRSTSGRSTGHALPTAGAPAALLPAPGRGHECAPARADRALDRLRRTCGRIVERRWVGGRRAEGNVVGWRSSRPPCWRWRPASPPRPAWRHRRRSRLRPRAHR